MSENSADKAQTTAAGGNGKKVVMFYSLAKMALIAVAHVALGFFLYYGRVKRLSPVFGSDELVFSIPMLLAFCGYFFVACHAFVTFRPPVRYGLATLIAVVATAISFACFAMTAFSRYGT